MVVALLGRLVESLAVLLAPHSIRANMAFPTAVRTLIAASPAMAECVMYQTAGFTNMSNLLDAASIFLMNRHNPYARLAYFTVHGNSGPGEQSALPSAHECVVRLEF